MLLIHAAGKGTLRRFLLFCGDTTTIIDFVVHVGSRRFGSVLRPAQPALCTCRLLRLIAGSGGHYDLLPVLLISRFLSVLRPAQPITKRNLDGVFDL
ncbi:hypothetical protein ELH28_22825 [Rhizobium ruizarguesonis]|nr:hypothetical protein ELH28_22825 [Rhizobium ruizarguesonis]